MRTMSWMLPLVALVITGCGPTDPPKAVGPQPVSGQVVYDGKPAAGVNVYLFPTDAPTPPAIPRNPTGVTGEDGRFVIGTFGKDDGASPGDYMVLLDWPQSSKTDEEMSTDKLLGWYDAKHTTFTLKVKEGGMTIPPYKLPPHTTPPPEVAGIPGRN
jgi:hypothetical protein